MAAHDSELSDVPAGEEERRHHIGVGGEGEPIAAGGEDAEVEARLVFQGPQRRVVEGLDEDVVDQVLHRLAAAAVGQVHRAHADAAGCSLHCRERFAHTTANLFLPPPY